MDDIDEILCIYYLFSLICNLRTEYKRMRSVLCDQCWVCSPTSQMFLLHSKGHKGRFNRSLKAASWRSTKADQIVRA